MITEEQKAVALPELNGGASLSAATHAAGIHRSHYYRLKQRDPAYWAKVELAQAASLDGGPDSADC